MEQKNFRVYKTLTCKANKSKKIYTNEVTVK